MTATFSIVVPTFRQEHFIEQTLCSFRAQGTVSLEIIIVDGAESPKVRDVVQNFGDLNIVLISEKDKGQADAINKGFRHARGDILGWLNSDDVYVPRALEIVKKEFHDNPDAQAVYGNCVMFNEETGRGLMREVCAFDRQYLFHYDFLFQPSTFWRRQLWEATGELRIELNYGMDWEWFIRASEIGKFHRTQRLLSLYRLHSDHKSGVGGNERASELHDIVRMHGDSYAQSLWNDVAPRADQIAQMNRRLRSVGAGRALRALFPSLIRYRRHHIIGVVEMVGKLT